jgi:hypothetical protein
MYLFSITGLPFFGRATRMAFGNGVPRVNDRRVLNGTFAVELKQHPPTRKILIMHLRRWRNDQLGLSGHDRPLWLAVSECMARLRHHEGFSPLF